MAKISSIPKVDLSLVFEVDESEARALDALAGYGDDAFVKAFYEHLGEAYMEQHEAGLRSFLRAIRHIVPGILARMNEAEKVFAGTHDATSRTKGRA